MGSPIDVSGLGKLSVASDPKAPLLVVYGGIPVDQDEFDGIHREKKKKISVSSGVYMWNYMSAIQSRFHIFVAVSHHVDGDDSYAKLMTTVQDQSLNPSSQILYLFSGGYKPGKRLLTSKGADPFSSIYLVDIWMGLGTPPSTAIPDFYEHLVNKHSDMITYVHTTFGANNVEARDFIAKKLGPQKAVLVKWQSGEDGMQTHLRTNTVAVGMLP